MTESEWLTCENPQRMLRSLRREWEKGGEYYIVSSRKLRLWCLMCRFVSGRGHGDNLYRIIDRTDGADGGNAANNAGSWANPDFDEPGDPTPAMKCEILRDIIGNPFRPVTIQPEWLTPQALTLAQAAYEERETVRCLRCLGSGRMEKNGSDHPCPDCHGGHVVTGHLDPVRLAVLADALEEAGVPGEVECKACDGKGWHPGDMGCGACGATSAGSVGSGRVPHPLLAHLRSPGPHHRGCWAADLLTGKE